jgi:uncharacterized protein HemY
MMNFTTLGRLLMKSGQLDDAKKSLNEALNQGENDIAFAVFGVIFSQSAYKYKDRGQFKNHEISLINGKGCLNRALVINPKMPGHMSSLAT